MKKLYLFVITLFVSLFITVSSTFANSALRRWNDGSSSSGVCLVSNNPIDVLKEDLVFNLDTDSATVSAEYTFYNSSDTDIEAELIFPIGKFAMSEDYEIWSYLDEKTIFEYNPKVYVNSTKIESSSRLLGKNKNETIIDSLDRLQDTYIDTYDHDYYKCVIDKTGYSEDDIFHFESANYSFIFIDNYGYDVDFVKTLNTKKDHVYLHSYSEPDDIIVKDKNGNEVPYTIEHTDYTGNEFCIDFICQRYGYDFTKDYSMVDIYNATYDVEADYDNLYVAVEYKISIPAKSSITNKVETELYYGFDEYYNPTAKRLCYYVTPASTFQSFKDLNITINTYGLYVVENNINLEKVDELAYTYTLHYDELPEEDISLILSEDSSCYKYQEHYNNSRSTTEINIVFIIFIIVILSVLIIVPLIFYIKKKLIKNAAFIFAEGVYLLGFAAALILIYLFDYYLSSYVIAGLMLIPIALRVLSIFIIDRKKYRLPVIIIDIGCAVVDLIILVLYSIVENDMYYFIPTVRFGIVITIIIYTFNISFIFFRELFKKENKEIE